MSGSGGGAGAAVGAVVVAGTFYLFAEFLAVVLAITWIGMLIFAVLATGLVAYLGVLAYEHAAGRPANSTLKDVTGSMATGLGAMIGAMLYGIFCIGLALGALYVMLQIIYHMFGV